MLYNGTKIEVKLGDRVLYRHLLLGKSEGVVAYLPGVSEPHSNIGSDQWVVRLANGKGVFMLYTGAPFEFAHRRIEFITRGSTELAITSDEDI